MSPSRIDCPACSPLSHVACKQTVDHCHWYCAEHAAFYREANEHAESYRMGYEDGRQTAHEEAQTDLARQMFPGREIEPPAPAESPDECACKHGRTEHYRGRGLYDFDSACKVCDCKAWAWANPRCEALHGEGRIDGRREDCAICTPKQPPAKPVTREEQIAHATKYMRQAIAERDRQTVLIARYSGDLVRLNARPAECQAVPKEET